MSHTVALLLAIGLLASQAAALTIEKDVTVNKKTCDVVTWTDAAGKQRSVALVHADGDGKFKGGYIEQYKYFLGDKQVTAKSDESMSGVSGLGCAVDHHGAGASASKACSNATTAFLVEGASHCIWRFKGDMSGPNKDKGTSKVPVVIDYAIADGRNDVLWSVSYDCSKLADGEVSWDARGPYVQFDWDGDGKFFGTKVSGIRWGDKFHFKTVVMNGPKSSWDYTQPCTIPYMMLYKSDNLGDAELAMVQTQTWKQKPAGGYWFSAKDGWGKTGPEMMKNFNCTYQLNAYENWESEKMAWGNNYGFVGVSKYDCLDFQTKGKGWPLQGYAVFICAGRHSDAPGDKMIAAMESVQKTTLTATKGTVAEKVTGFAGLEEQATAKPAGWNGVWGQWEVACDGGAAEVNVDTGEGSLPAATICFTGWTGAKATVTLNGAELAQGKDCFVSVDAAGKRLFVTLAKPLQGAKNAVAVK